MNDQCWHPLSAFSEYTDAIGAADEHAPADHGGLSKRAVHARESERPLQSQPRHLIGRQPAAPAGWNRCCDGLAPQPFQLGRPSASASEDDALAAQPLSTGAELAAEGAVPSSRARLSICAGVSSAPCARCYRWSAPGGSCLPTGAVILRGSPRAGHLIRGTWHSVRHRATRRSGSSPAVSEPTPPEHTHRKKHQQARQAHGVFPRVSVLANAIRQLRPSSAPFDTYAARP